MTHRTVITKQGWAVVVTGLTNKFYRIVYQNGHVESFTPKSDTTFIDDVCELVKERKLPDQLNDLDIPFADKSKNIVQDQLPLSSLHEESQG